MKELAQTGKDQLGQAVQQTTLLQQIAGTIGGTTAEVFSIA
jgi:hypothetical protein